MENHPKVIEYCTELFNKEFEEKYIPKYVNYELFKEDKLKELKDVLIREIDYTLNSPYKKYHNQKMYMSNYWILCFSGNSINTGSSGSMCLCEDIGNQYEIPEDIIKLYKEIHKIN